MNGELKISVQDNGPGVPESLQHKIMELFSPLAHKVLALAAVVQMVCHAHGGRLELISKEERALVLPCAFPLNVRQIAQTQRLESEDSSKQSLNRRR